MLNTCCEHCLDGLSWISPAALALVGLHIVGHTHFPAKAEVGGRTDGAPLVSFFVTANDDEVSKFAALLIIDGDNKL